MISMFIVVLNTFNSCSITTDQVTELSTLITTSINTLICSVFSTLRASRPTSTCFEGNGIEFILSDEDIEEMLIFRIETLGSMLDNVFADASSIIEFVMMEHEGISNLIPSYEEVVVGSSRGYRITRTKQVTLNLIDLLNNIANVATLLSKPHYWNVTEWPALPAQVYYIILNVPVAATEKMKKACLLFTGNSEALSMTISILAGVVGMASTVIPVIGLVFQYCTTISSLKKERRAVFFQIAIARKDDVLRLKQRLDDTESGEEDNSITGTFGATVNSQSNTQGTNDDGGFNENDFDGPDSARVKESEDEMQKAEVIAQGMSAQMITMMQMPGMSIAQIAEMMRKGKKEEADEGDEDEEEKKEGKEGEKEETKSEKAKREADEKKAAEDAEKEVKLKGHSTLTPQQQELFNKINKMSNFIPTSFYVRVVVGIVLIISGAAFFYVMCIFALTHSAKYYNSVTLTSYKCVVAMQLGVLALEMANSINYEVPGIYTTVPFATGRWIDSRHLSSDMPLIQDLMLEEINYYNAINILANQGSKSANVFPTGDVDFDGLAVEPTVKAGSKVPDIMSETRECFENDADDCDYEDRVYGMKGQSFSGLQALVSKHLESAKLIATNPDPYSGVTLEAEDVQA
ncbi:hypothetical protein BLNAU_23507 [Blattamonas nauphoetae]|uniref:Uncharacterized protein n=1 Tax=Blattamonas nauphoetae TaxID=2049346 RepID=A0ABQ9WQG1_9EUKA|nr:hypothetical protein BLNAU_23507 [Blattamonas nauphoetae]